MTDTRRVCDLTPLDLLEAAFAELSQLGLTRGQWLIEIHLHDGVVRRAVPEPMPRVHAPRATLGRRQLGELGSAA